MKRRIGDSFDQVAGELKERLTGVPRFVRDGERVVPVAYDVEVVPLESPEQTRARDEMAAWAYVQHPRTARAALMRSSAFAMYCSAQQSDDGIGTSFMTPNERALASYEWGQRLRDLIEAGKRKAKAREPSVVVDIDWDE
jgi:hypothetical protein